MGRRSRSTKPLSFFAALPPQLKHQLRGQRRDTENSPEGGKHGQLGKVETRVVDPNDLLPTQPPDEDSEEDDGECGEAHPSFLAPNVAGPSSSTTPPPVSSVAASAAADPPIPTAIVLSRKRAASVDGTPRSKRRKGKERAMENENEGHPWDCTGLVPRYTDVSQVPKNLKKYFFQRHALWPAYSRLPLLMDDTGWFSVTPAAIAQHIAERCRCDVILDAFCGVGGNAIAFAQTCERVIAMDNDLTRLRLARHNALHHGVADRIEFVLADYVEWARSPAGAAAKEGIDVVFLSPPWGGPEYLSVGDAHDGQPPSYPLSAILPIPGDELFKLTVPLSPNIAYFLPRNMDIEQLSALATHLGTPTRDTADGSERTREWVEVEEEWVGDKLKAVTAYYGGLVDGV